MWFTKRDNTTKIAAPFLVAPSGQFQGADGKWSTFKLQAGSQPPQEFYVHISILSQAVWLPRGPDSCSSTALKVLPPISASECASQSGIQAVNNGISLGYQYNSSSTSVYEGIYALPLSPELPSVNITQAFGPDFILDRATAVFVTDTVSLTSLSSDSLISAPNSNIAATFNPIDLTLGTLGLASGDIKVTGKAVPDFLETLLNTNQIPSRSWGYTAGASYNSNGATGSLTLGGYDQLRIKGSNNASFAMPTDVEQTLLKLNVAGFTMGFGNDTQFSLTSSSSGQTTSFDAILDSTLPYLYLPGDICNTLASRLRLTYDSGNDIFYWNGTQPNLDIDQFSFTLVDNQQGVNKTSITLPFAALNLTTSWPIVVDGKSEVNFFPIRNSSQDDTYILGRSFFQEAYVIADYDRRVFTVSQAAFPSSADAQIVPIYNTTTNPNSGSSSNSTGNNNSDNKSGGNGLSGGAIAGIVIGVIIAGLIIAAALWFFWRKKKKTAEDNKNAEVQAAAFAATQEEKLGQQANRDRRDTYDTVLSGDTTTSHEMSAFPLEHRPSHTRHVSELSSDSEKTVANKLRTPPAIYEMPDTSYMSPNEGRRASPSPSPQPPAEALSREISTATDRQDAPSPLLSALSPASAREPLTAVSEAPASAGLPSPPTSPTPTRQLSQTPTRGTSRFSERSSDMQP